MLRNLSIFPALILFLTPLYLVKIKFGWLSTNVLEILIAGFVLAWMINRMSSSRMRGSRLIRNLMSLDSRPLRHSFSEASLRGNDTQREFLLPVILILAGALTSSLAANDPKTSFGILKSWFIVPILFAWASANLIKTKEDIKIILYALAGSGLVVCLVALSYLFSRNLTFDGRLAAFYLSPNHLAMYLAPAFLISLFLGIFAKNDKEKIFFYASSILMVVVIYFTFSYGAWLGILGGIVFVVARSPALRTTKQSRDITAVSYSSESVDSNSGLLRHPRRLGFLAMTIFVGVFLFLGNPQKFQNLLNFDRSSLQSRFMIWQSAGLMIKDHPLLGIGPGNFQAEYLANQKYFPPYLEWAVPQPHNLLLAFWLQTGLIGLIGFIWLFVLLLKILWQNKKEPVALALFTVLIYIFIHGLFDTPLWKNDLALVSGVITFLAMKATVIARSESSQ